ncbi:MAG: T9SS type A sorting domain-containing protein [Crocinitomicaceae bacterium]|nr:T9SS type A sorting domain-containing protein [Crocinitomicaceae bacterium]
MSKIFIVTFLFISSISHSQNEWHYTFPSSEHSSYRSIETDNNGNILVGGSFKGEVIFDSSVTTPENSVNNTDDCLLQKFDSAGNLLWTNTWGGVGLDAVTWVECDTSNNIYAFGVFSDTVDLDPGINTVIVGSDPNGTWGSFISKFDPQGNLIWVKTFENIRIEKGAVQIENDQIIAIGSFRNTADFDPGASLSELSTVQYSAESFVLKLNMSGDFMWVKHITNNAFTYLREDLSVDNEGNAYVCLSFNNTIEHSPFNQGNTFIGLGQFSSDTDGIIIKYSPAGVHLFSMHVSSIGRVSLNNIAVDYNNGLYISGRLGDVLDVGFGANQYTFPSVNGYRMFLMKLDSLNGIEWVNDYESNDNHSILDIEIDSNFLYSSGWIIDTLYISNNTVATHYNDGAYAAIYDLNGELQWIKSLSGPWGFANAIDYDNFGNIAIAGVFNQSINLEFSGNSSIYTTNGTNDCFIKTMENCQVSDHFIIESNGILQSSGDSGQYQWINCDSGVFMVGETNSNFTPLSNGSYSVQIEQNGCQSTSECFDFGTFGISEFTNYQLRVFPNPNSGEFIVEFNSPIGEVPYIIYNIFGKIVSEGQLVEQSQKIQLTHTPKGVYFFKTDDGSNPIKLIID